MKKRQKLALTGAFAMAMTLPLAADYSPPYNNDSWSVVDKAGCAVIANNGAFRLNPSGTAGESETPLTQAEWTGGCSDGLVDGEGALRLYFFEQDFTDYYMQYSGRADRGIFSGSISFSTSNRMDGKWDVPWGPETIEWKAGCNESGDFRKQCKPADGIAKREGFLRMMGSSIGRKSAPAAPECGSTPAEAMSLFNADFAGFTARWPNRGATQAVGGSRDQFQYSLFFGTEGLKLLAKYRACMAPADYEANRAALQGAATQGKTGCEQLSSSSGTCTASYPANWQ